MLPRGIRNNNPLNIRRTAKDQWKGLRAQQTDASFCQFDSKRRYSSVSSDCYGGDSPECKCE